MDESYLCEVHKVFGDLRSILLRMRRERQGEKFYCRIANHHRRRSHTILKHRFRKDDVIMTNNDAIEGKTNGITEEAVLCAYIVSF